LIEKTTHQINKVNGIRNKNTNTKENFEQLTMGNLTSHSG
jgi:hypothetical protein